MDSESAVRERFARLSPSLDERSRRLFVATEALALGHGGIVTVARATGVAPRTIGAGIKEVLALEASPPTGPVRIRRPGGGRTATIIKDPTLFSDLDMLVEPVTRGDPESPLRWTCKSIRRLADELIAMGHKTSARMVAKLLHAIGYSLQANRKTKEGSSHPDRNAQFEFINKKVKKEMAARNPVISVDAKKKELVGDFKNAGKELRPKGSPEPVRTHDFVIEELGRATPYGVYDIANNKGWVSVGMDHDTASFAVESIRRWWHSMGMEAFPSAKRLLITADGGGSNSSRSRLWKFELQCLSDELQMPISVCHFPPGTSKWNKVEHRLFSFITQNWRGKPLVTHQVIVSLISATTTKTGLKVSAQIDGNIYPTKQKVSDEDFSAINMKRDSFHGDWNYTIRPMG